MLFRIIIPPDWNDGSYEELFNCLTRSGWGRNNLLVLLLWLLIFGLIFSNCWMGSIWFKFGLVYLSSVSQGLYGFGEIMWENFGESWRDSEFLNF